MKTLNITSTKADYDQIYSELKEVELKFNKSFDWKKIKRSNLDQLQALLSIIKRQNINSTK